MRRRFIGDRDKEEFIKAINYYGIILIFAIGAGVGGVLSGVLGEKTIWISVVLLLVDCIMMKRKYSISV